MSEPVGSATVSGKVRRVCLLAAMCGPGMGDIVQRNIYLGLLRRAYPEARVTVAVGDDLIASSEEMLVRHGVADDAIACPTSPELDSPAWRDWFEAVREIRFDLCVVDPGSFGLTAAHARRAGIPVRIGIADGRADHDLTRVLRLPTPVFGRTDLYEYAVALARGVGITEPLRAGALLSRMPYRPTGVLSDVRHDGPLVAVHPGGGKKWNRRWPFDHYAQLCDRLVERGTGLVLTGGPDEADDLTELARRLPAGSARIVLTHTVNDLVELMDGVDLLVANDSGPAHVAAAMDTATVVLYGPTGTEFMWARIYRRHVGVSLRYECQLIGHSVRGPAYSRPCEHGCALRYETTAGPYPRCLTDLGVDRVWEAVQAQLGRVRPGARR